MNIIELAERAHRSWWKILADLSEHDFETAQDAIAVVTAGGTFFRPFHLEEALTQPGKGRGS